MTDNASSPEAQPPAGYAVNPDTAGSDYEVPTYEIAEEDRELAATIRDFDPATTPSPFKFVGGERLPSTLTMSALSPEMRAPIANALKAYAPGPARDAKEAELVHAAVAKTQTEVRIKAGLGEGANAFQRERFQIAREIYELDQEELRIRTELAEVVGWETVEDEVTGEAKPKAIEAIQGTRRVKMEDKLKQIEHHRMLLQGPEGDRREQKALHEAVEAEKARRADLAEEREARSRAEEIVREERVEQKARAYAKAGRSNLR